MTEAKTLENIRYKFNKEQACSQDFQLKHRIFIGMLDLRIPVRNQ